MLTLGPAEWKQPVCDRRMLNFALRVGFETRLCQPCRAQTRGKVEGGVKYAKGNMRSGMRFPDGAYLNRQRPEWCDTVANRRIHGTNCKVLRDDAGRGAAAPWKAAGSDRPGAAVPARLWPGLQRPWGHPGLGQALGDGKPEPGNRNARATERQLLPRRTLQPQGGGEAPLPDHIAIKGRQPRARLPASFPARSKCTSHPGFGLVAALWHFSRRTSLLMASPQAHLWYPFSTTTLIHVRSTLSRLFRGLKARGGRGFRLQCLGF